MAVQRWRLTFARGEATADRSQRDVDAEWDGALAGLVLEHGNVSERPRLAIGAPLPLGMTAGRELADIFLPERRRLHDVRSLLEPGMPADHQLIELYDVWPGEPPLPGLVIAGDYRVSITAAHDTVRATTDPFEGIGEAVQTLLDASEVPRTRIKGQRMTVGNLRPLVIDVAVAGSPARVPDTLDLWMRLRFHPSQGTGRPEEVVAALSSMLGRPLCAVRRHRERLWLRGELPN